MAVPSKVTDRINRLEYVEKRAMEARQADRAKAAALQAAKADLNARRDLLRDLSLEIFAWRDAVVKSHDGQRLWRLIGGSRLALCAFWFWDGLPISEDNPLGACTQVALDGPNHHFLFEEWRDGQPYREIARPTSALQLMDVAHPKLIESLQTFLSGTESWQPITDELDRRLARHTSR